MCNYISARHTFASSFGRIELALEFKKKAVEAVNIIWDWHAV